MGQQYHYVRRLLLVALSEPQEAEQVLVLLVEVSKGYMALKLV